MCNNDDMTWLKKASQRWVEQNNILAKQITELGNERTQLAEKYRIQPTPELEKRIFEINKLIDSLLKQMESVDMPTEAIHEGDDI